MIRHMRHVRLRDSWRFNLSSDPTVGNPCRPLQPETVSQVGPLLDQVAGPLASFTGDGAYDRTDVYGAVIERHPDALIIVPPRSSAVPSETAETAPTQRDQHLQLIAEHGRMGWQKPPATITGRWPRQRSAASNG